MLRCPRAAPPRRPSRLSQTPQSPAVTGVFSEGLARHRVRSGTNSVTHTAKSVGRAATAALHQCSRLLRAAGQREVNACRLLKILHMRTQLLMIFSTQPAVISSAPYDRRLSTCGARPRTARVCAPSRSRCCSRNASGSACGSRSSGGSGRLPPSLFTSQLLGKPGGNVLRELLAGTLSASHAAGKLEGRHSCTALSTQAHPVLVLELPAPAQRRQTHILLRLSSGALCRQALCQCRGLSKLACLNTNVLQRLQKMHSRLLCGKCLVSMCCPSEHQCPPSAATCRSSKRPVREPLKGPKTEERMDARAREHRTSFSTLRYACCCTVVQGLGYKACNRCPASVLRQDDRDSLALPRFMFATLCLVLVVHETQPSRQRSNCVHTSISAQ